MSTFKVSEADMRALQALIEAARGTWEQAQLMRAIQGRDLVRSDMAMQTLYSAMVMAENVTFERVPSQRKAKA